MEGLGADGQAAQFNGLLETGGDLQALQLIVGPLDVLRNIQ